MCVTHLTTFLANSRRQLLERRRPTSITLPFAIIKDSAAASHSRQSGKKPICFLDGRLCCVCAVLCRRRWDACCSAARPNRRDQKERTDLCVCDRYDGINSPQSDKRIFRWKKKEQKKRSRTAAGPTFLFWVVSCRRLFAYATTTGIISAGTTNSPLDCVVGVGNT